MSNRYKGGVISATPPTTTGGESGTASGAWTLEQQMQAQAAGLWPSQPPDPGLFIENIFSTWLYNGNNSVNTITNGIDLAGKGGLVWIKGRTATAIVPTFNNKLYDTSRGIQVTLESNTTTAQESISSGLTAFTSTGFVLGSASQTNIGFDASNIGKFASWTFRKQPKFFDIVTYTGTGSARTVAHNLGSTPGCIIVKSTSSTGSWPVYHRGVNGGTNPQNYAMTLNATAAQYALTNFWNNTAPTSSVFTVGAAGGETNETGVTYVAYLFAHNAGGFGLSGTEDVISCGSFVSNAGNSYTPIINLGWEPQWILTKSTSGADNWKICDTMRGLTANPTYANALKPNTDDNEDVPGNYIWLNSESGTSFGFQGGPGQLNGTFIYIAIRKGPMKTPTAATTVFSPNFATAPSNPYTITTGFPVDLSLSAVTNGTYNRQDADRLRGNGATNSTRILQPNLSAAESASGTNNYFTFANNTAIIDNAFWSSYGLNPVNWNFRRAPGFFDEVCYTGTGAGSGNAKPHNLGVVPELMIVKRRSASDYWMVYTATTGKNAALYLNVDDASFATGGGFWGDGSTTISPTASNFYVGDRTELNSSGSTYVAYLFATLAGVSKVGTYTGTGAAQTIDCGFTAGCRFLMIKRTNAIGDWIVYDTARGFTTSPNSYMTLNTTVAQVAGTNYAINAATGFQVTSYTPADFNAVGGTYIFLAIA